MEPDLTIRGIQVFQGFLDHQEQLAIVESLRGVAQRAPFFCPKTRYGKEMSVRMTSAGKYGWYSDARGYRYLEKHPSGSEWPKIPTEILRIWKNLTQLARKPDCCLVNFYGAGARMGLHQDKDEASFKWPVLSISLGDDGLFRVGNLDRGGKTESVWLRSGDVLIMGGSARLLHHGIDRIKTGSSTLLPDGGRINLTLRVVD